MAQAAHTDSVLEILDMGGSAQWSAVPGTPTTFSLSIRNGTQDAHEFELTLAEPADWMRINPARIALAPGAEAMTTLHVLIPTHAPLPAGDHQIVLELHDFEGTSFGGLVSTLHVAPIHYLDLAVTVRGPLMRRGIVEGFVLHCVLVNRGNAECAVHTFVDGGPDIAFRAPNVRVPSGGEISFDVEARWTWEAVSAYPPLIRIVARHTQGDVHASVAWEEVAASLGSALPPLREVEEFPEILPRPRLETVRVSAAVEPEPDREPSAIQTTPDVDIRALEPVRVQINGPSPVRSSYGRRMHPWWPPVERFGGRWRVKPLPTVVAIVLALLSALTRLSINGDADVLAPYGTLPALLHASRHHHQAQSILWRSAHTRDTGYARFRPVSQTSRNARKPARTTASRLHTRQSPHHARAAGQAFVFEGRAWQGAVAHISASNIKVYGSNGKSSRSFILTPNFKNVFSADGTQEYSRNAIRPGDEVRVFYSYTFGIRHANAILVLRGTDR